MKINTNTWQLQDAKSKFSHLVEKALCNGLNLLLNMETMR